MGALIGAGEIAAGAVLIATGVGAPIGGLLIAAGAGQLISALGTILFKGPAIGFSTTQRNPTAPWKYVYGQTRVGGTVVFINTWPKEPSSGLFWLPAPIPTSSGGNNQMLDMVIVLAAHSIQSVDALLFDMQRVSIDAPTGGIGSCVRTPQDGTGAMNAGPYPGTGVSFTPVQQNVGPGSGGIPKIERVNGVVTVTLNNNIPYLVAGDLIAVANIPSPDQGLNGTWRVQQIISQVFGSPGSITFTYLCGGANVIVTNQGQVNTLWADYGRTVYFEPMLGGQSFGQSLQGTVFGTPLGGDLGDIVSPGHTGGVPGADQPNPWPSSQDGQADNASLLGKSAVFLRIQYNSTYYKGGIPQISFLVHGKNDILDPRTSPATIGYTANAALCIADFLSIPRLFGGFGQAYGTQIGYPDLIAAANTCDEQVPLAYSLASPPLTENNFECNGQFTLDMHRGEILQNLLTSCAGRITYIEGLWAIWPGAWVGNSFAIGSNPGGGVIPLGNCGPNSTSYLIDGEPATDIAAGPVRWRPSSSSRELYNGCKGTYVSAANLYQATDFPPYCQDDLHGYGPGGLTPYGSSTYAYDASLEADGGDRRWLEISLPFTTSSSMAQRIAKIEYLRRRLPAVSLTRATGTLTLNMTAYQVVTLDLMLLTIPYLSLSSQQVEVIAFRLHIVEGNSDGQGPAYVVELDVQEVEETIYDWSTLEELSPAGYQQPVLPSGSFTFTSTETVPGVTVPFPWSPAFIIPLIGDALYTGPNSSGVSMAKATFGLQIIYDNDGQGNPALTLEVQGTDPPNELSGLNPPQITCTVGTAGHLPPGNYLVGASVLDSLGFATVLSVLNSVTIPESSPPADNGSITVTINYPGTNTVPTPPSTPQPPSTPGRPNPNYVQADVSGAEIFMGLNEAAGKAVAGMYRQGTQLSPSTTSYTIEQFDQSQPGPPDASVDHYAVSLKKVIHSGCFAEQVQVVTSSTITLGGGGMTANQWADYVLSLSGKLDSTQELIVLNMPISSSTASSTQTINGVTGEYYTLTIGNNSAGQHLPDLTQLLVVGDLLTMRFKTQFTTTSVSDPNIANPYYPQGDTGTESGHVAMVLTGPDAGDVQIVSSVSTDINGNYTIYELAAPWAIQPNDGDIVIITEALWGPEYLTQSFISPKTNAVSGVIAAPELKNLAGQTWIAIVLTQDTSDDNGLNMYAPVRDFYVFGSQGTRTITSSQSMLPTDSIIDFDCTNGDIIYTTLPFYTIPNQKWYGQKIDSTTNTALIQTFAAPDPAYYLDTFNVPGTVGIGTNGTPTSTITGAYTILQVYANIISPPIGSNLIVQLKLNGTVWATLTILAGKYTSNIFTTSPLTGITTGETLQIYVTQVGSGNPGTNLSVIVQFTGGPDDTINGVTSVELADQWDYLEFSVSAD